MQAFRPRYRNLVPIRRWDQAERSLLRQRAMTFSVEVHIPAELAVTLGVLTRHVVDIVCRTSFNWLLVIAHFHLSYEPVALSRVSGGQEKRLAAGGGERVTQRREHHEEEDNYNPKKRSRNEVQETPLPVAPLRSREVHLTHFSRGLDPIKCTFRSRTCRKF